MNRCLLKGQKYYIYSYLRPVASHRKNHIKALIRAGKATNQAFFFFCICYLAAGA
jgi:hypothetical protein